MKVIFLGTPEFACTCLESIINSKHQVVAVVCQPDKPSGRGNKLCPPPVKILANAHNIPVFQFNKIRVQGVDVLKELNADIMVTAAYGQILSQEIIDICPHKIINVHGSLLPKYRGASPIQAAILNGETKTGITIMETEIGVDTGDIMLMQEMVIDEQDTFGTLSEKLAILGSKLIVEALDKIEDGTITKTPQEHDLATHTKMIKKDQELLDFNDTAQNLVNKVRAYNPNPVAKFNIGGDSFKVYSLKALKTAENGLNGQVLYSSPKHGFIIKCQDGAVEVIEMQAPNSKRMLAKSYLNGKKIEVGTIVNG